MFSFFLLCCHKFLKLKETISIFLCQIFISDCPNKLNLNTFVIKTVTKLSEFSQKISMKSSVVQKFHQERVSRNQNNFFFRGLLICLSVFFSIPLLNFYFRQIVHRLFLFIRNPFAIFVFVCFKIKREKVGVKFGDLFFSK